MKLNLDSKCGIHEVLFKILEDLERSRKINKEEAHELFKNILLTGGNVLQRNFKDRMKNEIKKLTDSRDIKIVVEPFAKHAYEFEIIDTFKENSSWKGGSILASLSSFQTKWITKKEYDELGPELVSNVLIKKMKNEKNF